MALDCRYIGGVDGQQDYVVEHLVSCNPTRCFLADHGMSALGVYVWPAMTFVGDTSRMSTTRTALSSTVVHSVQLAIGKASSQSPLCGATEAK